MVAGGRKQGIERTFRNNSSGIDPYFLGEEEIRRVLTREVLVELPIERITDVYFYGAGCIGLPGEMLCLQSASGDRPRYGRGELAT